MTAFPPLWPDYFPLTKDDIVVNLGAHQGRLTVYFGTKVRRVVAVEPVGENYDRLIEAVRAVGLRNVTAMMAAIGSWTHVGFINIGTNDENHSTLRRFGGETRPIMVYSWDDMVKLCKVDEVRLAKVDVEGSEMEWLKGMTHTFPECYMLEEHTRFGFYTLEELTAQLEDMGYTHVKRGLHIYGQRKA